MFSVVMVNMVILLRVLKFWKFIRMMFIMLVLLLSGLLFLRKNLEMELNGWVSMVRVIRVMLMFVIRVMIVLWVCLGGLVFCGVQDGM